MKEQIGSGVEFLGASHPVTGTQAPRPAEASRLGGQAVVRKYGKDYMANLGRKGSRAVVKKYGLRFYSEIAARNRGVRKRRANPAS